MAHITPQDLMHVIAGLRQEADHILRLQYLLPDQHDFYQAQYDKTAELVSFFEAALDRYWRSENLSIRISVKSK